MHAGIANDYIVSALPFWSTYLHCKVQWCHTIAIGDVHITLPAGQ